MFEALTVKELDPSVVGVPESIPLEPNVSPDGILPLTKEYDVASLALIATEYEESLIAIGSGELVVNTGAPTIILNVNARSTLPAVFEALIVKEDVCSVVGVPEITPPEDSESPNGKVPIRE